MEIPARDAPQVHGDEGERDEQQGPADDLGRREDDQRLGKGIGDRGGSARAVS